MEIGNRNFPLSPRHLVSLSDKSWQDLSSIAWGMELPGDHVSLATEHGDMGNGDNGESL